MLFLYILMYHNMIEFNMLSPVIKQILIIFDNKIYRCASNVILLSNVDVLLIY